MKPVPKKFVLSQKEYIFTGKSVPDMELLACRLWEYGRESTTMRGLMERVFALDIKAVSEVSKKHRHSLPLACAIWSGKAKLPVPGKMYFPPQVNFTTPWQNLPREFRREVGNQFHLPVTPKGEKKKIYPAGFYDADLAEFHFLVKAHRERWDKPSDEIYKSLGSEEARKPFNLKVEWNEGPFLPSRLAETRVFTFNWRCRNEQIVAAFKMWVQKNRPPQWENDAKGEKVTSFRVDLERLGLMRKIKADPNHADAENNKEARRALLCFRELFPTLIEYPLNWPWPVDATSKPQE